MSLPPPIPHNDESNQDIELILDGDYESGSLVQPPSGQGHAIVPKKPGLTRIIREAAQGFSGESNNTADVDSHLSTVHRYDIQKMDDLINHFCDFLASKNPANNFDILKLKQGLMKTLLSMDSARNDNANSSVMLKSILLENTANITDGQIKAFKSFLTRLINWKAYNDAKNDIDKFQLFITDLKSEITANTNQSPTILDDYYIPAPLLPGTNLPSLEIRLTNHKAEVMMVDINVTRAKFNLSEAQYGLVEKIAIQDDPFIKKTMLTSLNEVLGTNFKLADFSGDTLKVWGELLRKRNSLKAKITRDTPEDAPEMQSYNAVLEKLDTSAMGELLKILKKKIGLYQKTTNDAPEKLFEDLVIKPISNKLADSFGDDNPMLGYKPHRFCYINVHNHDNHPHISQRMGEHLVGHAASLFTYISPLFEKRGVKDPVTTKDPRDKGQVLRVKSSLCANEMSDALRSAAIHYAGSVNINSGFSGLCMDLRPRETIYEQEVGQADTIKSIVQAAISSEDTWSEIYKLKDSIITSAPLLIRVCKEAGKKRESLQNKIEELLGDLPDNIHNKVMNIIKQRSRNSIAPEALIGNMTTTEIDNAIITPVAKDFIKEILDFARFENSQSEKIDLSESLTSQCSDNENFLLKHAGDFLKCLLLETKEKLAEIYQSNQEKDSHNELSR